MKSDIPAALAKLTNAVLVNETFLFGSSVLFLMMIPMGRPVLKGVMQNLAIIFYVSVVVTALGFLFYFLAIKVLIALLAISKR